MLITHNILLDCSKQTNKMKLKINICSKMMLAVVPPPTSSIRCSFYFSHCVKIVHVTSHYTPKKQTRLPQNAMK